MKKVRFALLATLVALPCLALAAPADNAAAKQVTLEMRKESGPYKNAAYSFRLATQDAAVHKNYVDLLLNKCGNLHIKTVGGVESRITDLGAMKLADAPKEALADAKWNTESVKPEAGHVYLQEIKAEGQTMTVKFHVDEANADTVKLTWVTVTPLAGPAPGPGRGAAGTKGQCGGAHPAK